MNRTLMIASILLLVAVATTHAGRYGEGEGLDPASDGAKPTSGTGAATENADPNFSGVNNAGHKGVNGGQAQSGSYGSQ